MNEIVERFEVAFNQIHQHLKELNHYPKNDNFVELLQRSKLKHSVIREHFTQLKQYAKLRNAIVHERTGEDYYIATPHVEVVQDLEKIKQTLDQPPKALEFASQPVQFFLGTTPLTTVLNAFRKHQVSQFPVYSDDHVFLGLLTSDDIVAWLSNSTDPLILGPITASDVLDQMGSSHVEVISTERTVYDLEERFEQSLADNRKLKAILLTKSGEANEHPSGIVTTWDLIKVRNRQTNESS